MCSLTIGVVGGAMGRWLDHRRLQQIAGLCGLWMSSPWVHWFPPTDQKLPLTHYSDGWRREGPCVCCICPHVEVSSEAIHRITCEGVHGSVLCQLDCRQRGDKPTKTSSTTLLKTLR